MRVMVAGLVLSTAALLPRIGTAQVYYFSTPPPEVTAASAVWQINSEPIVSTGLLYCPTSTRVFFNPLTMDQVGVYQGVPLYADTTVETYSLVYVPVGGGQMRAYERPRAGPLAGTEGSRTPSFPVQLRPSPFASPQCGCPNCAVSEAGPAQFVVPVESAVERAAPAAAVPVAAAPVAAPAALPPAPPAPVDLRSIPPPQSSVGVWIELDGARWQKAGAAVVYDPDAFTRIGEYRGFPVYRRASGSDGRIYVPAVPGGALTPYERR